MTISAEQILGFAAGVLTSVSALPQLVKIIKEKQAKDVSLKTLFILLSGISLWIVYGIFKKDVPIIVTNSLSLILNTGVMILRIKYPEKK
jgi:MtN3 and saliva related transmembrane protein